MASRLIICGIIFAIVIWVIATEPGRKKNDYNRAYDIGYNTGYYDALEDHDVKTGRS